ncbi:TPA: phage tail protein [Morganella morganii]
MTAKYFAILTNYGAAQLANAVALGTQINISAMGAGDGGGTLPVPDPAQTKLVRENRRAAVNQVSVDDKNPNIIIAEQVIPENEGGWWIREIGLYDDKGGLIAIGNAPETYKPNLQEGSGRTQVLQMALIVSSTQAVTLKVDPSVVLATREYVTKSIDAAIQASETKAAKIYATKTELSSGLSGKQPTGDYATRTELNNGLSGKQPAGDYATKTEVNSKIAKDKNGADIPDKEAFIGNLGLPEKFQPIGTYADGTVFRALSGDGASISELSGKYLLAVKEDGTVVLHDRIKGRSLWAILGGALAQITGNDPNLIMSQKAITDALNLLTPLSSFTSGAGWIRLPDGTIIQQGVSIAGQLTYPTTIQFPIPFTSVPTVIACFDSASNKATDCPSFATSAAGGGLTHFFLMSSRTSGGESAGANWIAIAKGK